MALLDPNKKSFSILFMNLMEEFLLNNLCIYFMYIYVVLCILHASSCCMDVDVMTDNYNSKLRLKEEKKCEVKINKR